ncbi:MAG: PEP-CTERM sorting domain-containing protein, partial [Gammaproteobacteria bacterium]|nr:PEP-CTERM sorting domain-containing protein [Gammaproteobacteria bacterium]
SGTLFDFFFAPELDPNPVNPLLTILFDPGPGKFTFVLEAIEVVGQGQTFLLLSGTGTLNGSDLDATPFDFSMSVDGSTQDLFTFSGTLSSATVVPVPGALILFMSGLTMLGFRRRS